MTSLDPLVPVFPHPKIPGHPRPDAPRIARVPLSFALTRGTRTDAHFAGYASPEPYRLTRRSAEELGVPVEMVLLIHDVDAHQLEVPIEAWWEDERQKVAELLAHSDGFAYRTRGGYRLVHRLAPWPIVCAADSMAWRTAYLDSIEWLNREYQIEADRACKDWPRLYRIPHATRTPGGPPENLETLGDPRWVGCWPRPLEYVEAPGRGSLSQETDQSDHPPCKRRNPAVLGGPFAKTQMDQSDHPRGADRTIYGSAALAGLAGEMQSTPEGGRAMAAFRVAARAGSLAAAGVVDGEEAGRVLVEAAVAAGLTDREASGHVGRGLEIGARSPAKLPARSRGRRRWTPSAADLAALLARLRKETTR